MTTLLPNNNSRILGNKVDAVPEEVRMIHDEFYCLGFDPVERPTPERPTPEVTEAVPAILGRDGDKQRLMDMLSSSNPPMTILPIIGLPGIGKTTLARSIFDNAEIPNDYNHRVWVNLSGKVDLAEIGNSIISEVVPEEAQDDQISHESVRQRLGELCNGKKVLIVLDDLWDEDSVQLANLKCMLTFGDKVTVIVTTREKYIADKFCTVEPQELDPLSDDTCWEIIKRESGFEVKSHDNGQRAMMEQLGVEIAKKCGGVPVSAQVFGRLLRHDVSVWQKVREGAAWYQFPAALELGYRRMTAYVRLCLAYCGIFPRGHCVAKDDLIRQWIALDLIGPSEDASGLTHLADKYFEMLLGMSFLQPAAKSDSTSGGNGKGAILFTMHDLAHEFARYTMGEELIVLDARMDALGNERCRYALVAKSGVGPLKLPPNIRGLYSVGCSKMELSDDSFSSAMCLRVLAFIKCSMQKIPDSICQLWNLRYLNLSGCSGLEILPRSFGELINLVHMDLSGCSGLVNLPDSFSTLTKLACVNLSGCSALQNVPQSFGELIGLVRMDLSGCSGLEILSLSFGELKKLVHMDLSGCSGLVNLPDSFSTLTKLACVNLSGCSALQNVPQSFGELIGLVRMDLSGCSRLENLLESFGKLVNMDLSCCLGLISQPKSLVKLINVVHMDLSSCSMLKNLPESFGELKSLVHMNLSGCSGLEKLPKSFVKLMKLEYMDLSGCSNLGNLPESFGELINLVQIDLSGCCRLVNLPESFANLVNLEHVSLAGCYGIEKLSEPLKKLTKLVYLDLSFWSCFEVIKDFDRLTNLEHLNLSHPCCYTSEQRTELYNLSDHFGYLTKLRYLNLSMSLNPIFFYKKNVETDKYIKSCVGDLTNLEYLDLSHNTFLSDLPISLGSLRKLHTLDLTGCIRLKEVPKEIAELDSLELICFRKCRDPVSCQLVVRCDEGAQSSISFAQLEDVEHCEVLEMSCLEKVKSTEEAQRIRLADKHWVRTLKLCWTVGSQENVQDPNALLSKLVPPHSLQSLELHGYNGKTCFPTWLTSDTFSFNLLNIVKFAMEDIPRCSRVPPIGLLPNLQTVTLRKMASIRRIDAGDLSGGNSAAFNQLSSLTIDDMESLEDFSTRYCRGGVEFVFPKINKLVLRKCPKLRLTSPDDIASNSEISDCENVKST